MGGWIRMDRCMNEWTDGLEIERQKGGLVDGEMSV